MNPWIALVLGLFLGWLIEYVIDLFFWRRKTADEETIEDLEARLQTSQERVADLETQLAAAQTDNETLQVRYEALQAEKAEVEAAHARHKAGVQTTKEQLDSGDLKRKMGETLAGLGVGAAAGAAIASGEEAAADAETESPADEAAGEETAPPAEETAAEEVEPAEGELAS